MDDRKSDRMAKRQDGFKNVSRSVDGMRQRRHNSSSELRTMRRGDQIAKRRMEMTDTTAAAEESSDGQHQPIYGTLHEIMAAYEDPALYYRATNSLRRLLSRKENPPIQDVIDSQLIEHKVMRLLHSDDVKLQFEAAWTITNIASGTREQTEYIVQQGGVPVLVQLMMHPDSKVREQCIWAIGNIAGDGQELRDTCIDSGGVDSLLSVLNDVVIKISNQLTSLSSSNTIDANEINILRTGVWTLSNFCRGKDVEFAKVRPAITALSGILQLTTDEQVIRDACWALSYVTDTHEQIQAVLETMCGQHLVKMLSHDKKKVQTPALRAIGNILTGNELQTQGILNFGALEPLMTLLWSEEGGIRKEACWAVSNIAAEAKKIKLLVENPGIMQKVTSILMEDPYEPARREAAWTLTNIGLLGTPDECQAICLRYDMLPSYVRYIKDSHKTKKLPLEMLRALNRILDFGNPSYYAGQYGDTNIFVDRIEKEVDMEELRDFYQANNSLKPEKLEQILDQLDQILQKHFNYDFEAEPELGGISDTLEQTNYQLS